MVNRTAMGVIALCVALVLPSTALALALVRRAHDAKASSARIGRSTTSSGAPQVGALYASSSASEHTCTASVVHSPRGNTLLTAAHCVAGSGVGMVFAPGQRGAKAPYGRWIVTGVYVEPAWAKHQDPHADVAFLTVAPRRIDGVSTEIEKVTGAYRLGSTAVRGERVTISGYPVGSTNDAVTCAASVYITDTYPSFDCRGFVDGTSGGPWLRVTRQGTAIVGVTGGLHQGGCYDHTSFSSRLGRDAELAYHRAAEAAPADVAPQPGGDGC